MEIFSLAEFQKWNGRTEAAGFDIYLLVFRNHILVEKEGRRRNKHL